MRLRANVYRTGEHNEPERALSRTAPKFQSVFDSFSSLHLARAARRRSSAHYRTLEHPVNNHQTLPNCAGLTGRAWQ